MKLLVFLFIVMSLSGCGNSESLVLPTPTATSPTSVPNTPAVQTKLSGTVYAASASGREPLAGAGIDVSAEFQSQSPFTFSDANGRFSFDALAGVRLKIVAGKPGFSQPCRVPVNTGTLDHEVYLVSDATLSTAGVPSTMPLRDPVLRGRVVEQTGEGPRPVAGAAVVGDFSGGMGWSPSATTKTDADGRYLLCNADVTASGLGLMLWVTKSGYGDASIDVPNGQINVDIELKR